MLAALATAAKNFHAAESAYSALDEVSNKIKKFILFFFDIKIDCFAVLLKLSYIFAKIFCLP